MPWTTGTWSRRRDSNALFVLRTKKVLYQDEHHRHAPPRQESNLDSDLRKVV